MLGLHPPWTVLKSVQKPWRYGALNIFVSKNAHFWPPGVDFTIFRQNAISKRLNIIFETRIDKKEENWSFSQILAKMDKKYYYGALYCDFSEKSKFWLFCQNFVFKRLQRLASAFSKFFSADFKVLCWDFIHHERF